MKRITMKTLFYIPINKINKKGTVPIYCRLTVNGRRSEISTGLFIKPEIWDTEQAKPDCVDNVMLNATLTKIKSAINRIYHELIFNDKPVSAEIIRDIYTGKNKTHYTFLELVEKYIESNEQKTNSNNTLKNYKSRKNILINYLTKTRKTQLLPEEFTTQFAEKFLHYMLHEKKYGLDYARRAIMFAKAILTYAVKNNVTFRTLTDYPKGLSAHFTKALKYGRIIGTKQKGQNRYIYSLPE